MKFEKTIDSKFVRWSQNVLHIFPKRDPTNGTLPVKFESRKSTFSVSLKYSLTSKSSRMI